MKFVHWKDIEAEDVEGGFKLEIRWLNTGGSDNFAVRYCEFKSGGCSPLHKHDWEHEIFILEGEGIVFGDEETKNVVAGNLVSIPAGETHQVKNASEKKLRLLCMEPK